MITAQKLMLNMTDVTDPKRGVHVTRLISSRLKSSQLTTFHLMDGVSAL